MNPLLSVSNSLNAFKANFSSITDTNSSNDSLPSLSLSIVLKHNSLSFLKLFFFVSSNY